MAKKDFLQEKHRKLSYYQDSFNSTMSIMNQSVNILGTLIEGIDATIEEIDAYQKGLEVTRKDLEDQKVHNQKVLGNIKKLLCLE